MVICCEAFDGVVNLADSVAQIRVHDAFYPHHMRDLKAVAKRGKILVLTLVVSAGLMALVSTAILKSGKEKGKADTAEAIAPAVLRACVIAAATTGRRGLAEGRERALSTAFSAYASARSIEWKGEITEYSTSMTCSIGGDSVTVIISDDSAVVEVRAICGNMGASATADAANGSVKSSIFTSHAMEREADL